VALIEKVLFIKCLLIIHADVRVLPDHRWLGVKSPCTSVTAPSIHSANALNMCVERWGVYFEPLLRIDTFLFGGN
jgi:hypothetical protein